jgi:hypothetical protein
LLSSLLHLRDVPDRKHADGSQTPLSEAEVEEAVDVIRAFIEGFDYAGLLAALRDPAALKAKFDATDVGYEKVQLNPREFDAVPSHVVES